MDGQPMTVSSGIQGGIMKKRVLALVLAGVTAASLLGGCGSAATAPAASATTDAAADTSADASADTADASADAEDVDDPAFMEFEDGDVNSYAPKWDAYDSLIDEIRTDTDLADREAKMHQAEDMLMATGAVLPLYYYNDLYMEKTEWSGDFASVFGTKYFMYAKKNGENADVMKINLASEPDHLDPALNTTVDGACLAANSFVGLYTNDKDDPSKVVPALADGDPEISEDGLTYTIHMKKDLKWSDGSTLNANDIIYSWNRAADPNTASDYSYLFAVIEGYGDGSDPQLAISAPDENTVQFTLAAPCPYIMTLLAFPVFMPVPQASVEAAADWETNPGSWASEAGFVSNGAFTLKEWKHNESMVYVKNPNYYDADNVSVDELDFMLSADDTAILAAYQAGDVDYIDTVPTNEIQNLKDGDDFHVIPNMGCYYVAFNVNSKMFEGKTATEAALERRALSMLIDRQYIIDTIGQTEQKVATSYIPEGMSDGNGGFFKENDDAYTFPYADDLGYYPTDVDVEGAVALLKQAGFKFNDDNTLSEETPISINYLTNDGSAHQAIAQAIQQDLAVIGVTMEITSEDWQTFLNDRKQGNFDVAREGWLADYDDPINMLEMFTTDSGNNDCQLGK